MNRVEMIGFFTALKALADSDNMPAIKSVIDAVLDEARTESKKDEKQT